MQPDCIYYTSESSKIKKKEENEKMNDISDHKSIMLKAIYHRLEDDKSSFLIESENKKNESILDFMYIAELNEKEKYKENQREDNMMTRNKKIEEEKKNVNKDKMKEENLETSFKVIRNTRSNTKKHALEYSNNTQSLLKHQKGNKKTETKVYNKKDIKDITLQEQENIQKQVQTAQIEEQEEQIVKSIHQEFYNQFHNILTSLSLPLQLKTPKVFQQKENKEVVLRKYEWTPSEEFKEFQERIIQSNSQIGQVLANSLKLIKYKKKDNYSQVKDNNYQERWICCFETLIKIEEIAIKDLNLEHKEMKGLVSFCTYDFSCISTPNEDSKESINVSLDIIKLLETFLCECEHLKLDAKDNQEIEEMINETIQLLQQTKQNSCSKFLILQIYRLIDGNVILPYQERLSDLLSSVIRYNLRCAFNPSSNNLLYQWKKNTGSYIYNNTNLAAAINYALFKIHDHLIHLENKEDRNDLECLKAYDEIIAAKLFLKSVLCWPGIFEDIERREKSCIETIEYCAKLIQKFHCFIEEQYSVLSNFRDFSNQLLEETQYLQLAKKECRRVIRKLFGKKRREYAKYELNRLIYPVLKTSK